MKAVMISVRPNWCAKITNKVGIEKNGKPIYEKTVEVRKTRPKTETPFPCFIYETQGRTETPWIDEDGHEIFKGRGQVIGEFVCDRIEEIGFSPEMHGKYICKDESFIKQTCIPFEQMFDYLGDGYGYGWHISDLVIYDKPKELSEFAGLRNTKFGYEPIKIKRPPQSWCYVEVQE